MTSPTYRAFACFSRGDLRDEALAQFRIGLRKLRNPETGNTFVEDEVSRATQRGGRWWIEGDGLDLVLMSGQARAIFLAQQMRPERAADSFLYGYHGELWGQTPIPAIGGSGSVNAPATDGTIFVGSTTVPDPAAHTARAVETGLRFQVLVGATAAAGVASITMIGIDTGEQTNLESGQVLHWENPPLGADPDATVAVTFRGGRSKERSSEFADRLQDGIRHKAAAGNRAHFRAWVREDANVLDAYIYPCALHAGSVLVAITQQRGGLAGPNALVADASLLAITRAYIVPPASPVVPERAFVSVTSFTPDPSDLTLRLSMPKGNSAGWTDGDPWPVYDPADPTVGTISLVGDGLHFWMYANTAPSIAAPHLMTWNVATSRWTLLQVQSVTLYGTGTYAVVLSEPATLTAGDIVCAANGRMVEIAQACEEYFDSLGPGELVNLGGDTRSDRAARFPEQAEEAPCTAGIEIIVKLKDKLGTSLSTAVPAYSLSVPTLPTTIIGGPHKLTLGKLLVFPID